MPAPQLCPGTWLGQRATPSLVQMGASWYCWWQHQSHIGLFYPLFCPLPPFVLLSGYQAHLSFL